MSVLNQELVESNSGFKKEIDEGGISLLLDTVQIYMYQFPAKSSIRESVSNAIDSISEKNIAKLILRGESKVSDFFVEKEGDIYKDSKFDESYYDLKYLSDNDTVYITYKEGNGIEIKDSITIRDNGVGLGGKRLEGYFKIAYSSKRLNTKVLGAFGMGAKAPLATGVDFYSLKTAHNGKEFSFLVYKDKVDSAYTKWNEDGSKNDYITFSNGFKVYYKNTTSTNYVETSWDVKRHQKHQYIDAVKSQLLYFKSPINFTVENQYYKDKIDFQANILYETEDFIIADQHYYSRPHLIVNGVCYGFIQFDELEMDSRFGSIGIKVNMDDIQVTPSRESCVWNSKTKDSILRKYTLLSQTAEKYINESLSSLDFLDWLSTCAHIGGLFRSSNIDKNLKIITNLASLAGFNTLKIKYKDTDFEFKQSLQDSINSNSMEMVRVHSESYWSSKSRIYKTRIKYSPSGSMEHLCGSKKYLQYSESVGLKSYYLVTSHNQYITIRPHSRSEEEFKDIFKKFVTQEITLEDAISELENFKCLIDLTDTQIENKVSSWTNALIFSNLLLNEKLPIYEDVKVPSDFSHDYDSESEEVINSVEDSYKVKEKIDYVKKRKENGKVLIHYPRLTNSKGFVKSNTEMLISEIQDFEGTLIYSFKEDEPLINFLYTLCRGKSSAYDYDSHKFEGDFRVCIIAKTAEKYFKEHTHIKKYIFGEDGNTPCKELVSWYTASRMREKFEKKELRYLRNFEEFSKSLKSVYEDLLSDVSKLSHPPGITRALNELPKEYKSKIELLYDFHSNKLDKSEEEFDEFCKTLDIVDKDEYLKVNIFDEEVLKKMSWVIEFDDVYGTLFSEIYSFINSDEISEELSKEIKEIIEFKRERLSLDYPDLCC